MLTNVLQWLECSVKSFGDKVAAEDEKKIYTYRELQGYAKRIGSSLVGVIAKNEPVAVFMEKSPEMLAAFFGIVYAGGFYVTVDTKHPKTRVESILNTLEARIIITDEANKAKLTRLELGIKTVTVEELMQGEISEEALLAVRKKALDVDPLYAIFTSGSTGTPKGVVVSHRSVIDFIENFTRMFNITGDDVIGNQAPFDFDVSTKDIYSCLKTGARLVIIPKSKFSFPTKLLDYLEEKQVTTLIWAVSALCIVTTLKGFDYKRPEHINKVIFSGEAMPVIHLNEWKKQYPDAMFVNVYGPTEITCNCTYYVVDKEYEAGEALPIGIPFPNEKVFLLDEEDKLIDEKCTDKTGEICVSGTSLALGYFGDEERTKAAFMQNPANTKYLEMMYRTGDLAYYGSDGLLHFVGRKDFQIKHMGHRIELGEIENAFYRVSGIRRACCIYNQEEGKIYGFYEGEADKARIVRELGNILPKFMLPNVLVEVSAMPLTKNGKVDRKKLMEETNACN